MFYLLCFTIFVEFALISVAVWEEFYLLDGF